MDTEEHEQLDLDFESMLDAVLGIEASEAPQQDVPIHAVPKHNSMRHHTQSMIVGSPVAYDQLSPTSSPTASPVHYYHPSPCSPCISSSSLQMHASDYSSSYAQSGGMYSPVRESGSPPPDPYSPVHQPPVTEAAIEFTSYAAPAASQQQEQQTIQPYATQQLQLPDQANSTQHTQQQLHDAQHHHVQICALPREVEMRVLCFLSADALTCLGCCNRQMRTLCSEPVLWRRLFVHRWGKKVKQSNALSWKVRYMERDGAELRAAAAAVEARDAMQDMFVQAMLAKRQQALGRAAVDDLMLVDDDEIAAKVAAWRRSRGFDQDKDHTGATAEPQRPSDLTQHLPTARSGHTQGASVGAAGFKRPGVVRRRGFGPAIHHYQQQQQGLQQDGNSVSGQRQQGCLGHKAGSDNEANTAATAGVRTPAAAAWSGSYVTAAAGLSVAVAAGASSPRAQSSSIAAAAAADSERALKRQRRRWTQIGNVFCDEMTGWIHVCDETCSEKIIEPSSGLLVCPISGSVSERMMTCAEEEAEEGPRDGHEGNNGHAEDDYSGATGRLARAFAAGYYCSDEKELLRTCGVRLSR